MGLFKKKHKKIAVLLTCADWRLHQRKVDLNARLTRRFGVDGVDLVAVPGPDGLVLPERCAEWAAVLAQVKLLVKAHSAETIIVAGHQRCAGNPVSDAQHDENVCDTAKELKDAAGFPGPVHAVVLVYQSDTKWDIRPLAQF